MGNFFSPDCGKGTTDTTKWYQSSRRCTANGTDRLKKKTGSSFTTGYATENCNLQHRSEDTCWGRVDAVDNILNCIGGSYMAVFPGQDRAVGKANACSQGCTSYCTTSTNFGTPVGSSMTVSTEAGMGVGAALVLGLGALAMRKRKLKSAEEVKLEMMSSANIA